MNYQGTEGIIERYCDCGRKALENCVENADHYCNKCLHCSRVVSVIVDKFIPDTHPYDTVVKSATFVFDTAIHYYSVAQVTYEYDLKPKLLELFPQQQQEEQKEDQKEKEKTE